MELVFYSPQTFTSQQWFFQSLYSSQLPLHVVSAESDVLDSLQALRSGFNVGPTTGSSNSAFLDIEPPELTGTFSEDLPLQITFIQERNTALFNLFSSSWIRAQEDWQAFSMFSTGVQLTEWTVPYYVSQVRSSLPRKVIILSNSRKLHGTVLMPKEKTPWFFSKLVEVYDESLAAFQRVLQGLNIMDLTIQSQLFDGLMDFNAVLQTMQNLYPADIETRFVDLAPSESDDATFSQFIYRTLNPLYVPKNKDLAVSLPWILLGACGLGLLIVMILFIRMRTSREWKLLSS